MKTFLFCESTEGGMEVHEIHSFDELGFLRGWLDKDCRADDLALIEWGSTAEIGDYTDHRLGICVRVA